MAGTENRTIDIGELLEAPETALAYRVSEKLRQLYPGRALIEGTTCSFDVTEFAAGGHCITIDSDSSVYNQLQTDWNGPGRGVSRSPKNAWYSVTWQDGSFEVLVMTWLQGFRPTEHYWIVGDTIALAEQLLTAISEFDAVVDGAVLVFDGGSWQKSKDLFRSIQGATFDNLILAGDLKDQVKEDIERFLASRETYESYGIPWKRGILLVGPPGNGKTHAVKAVINFTGAPCLYVKSFKSQHSTDHDNIRSVFQRARQTTPCVLVFEDLDSLIDDRNRSFFLNELDGFSANAGVMTLATTNHPDRLDTAITDRPSRFDRKYHFALPALPERRAYVAHWNTTLKPELQLTVSGINTVAESTAGYSFAYLKELFLTSLMAWINTGEAGGVRSMDAVIERQMELLRSQMASSEADVESAGRLAPGDLDEEMMSPRFR